MSNLQTTVNRALGDCSKAKPYKAPIASMDADQRKRLTAH